MPKFLLIDPNAVLTYDTREEAEAAAHEAKRDGQIGLGGICHSGSAGMVLVRAEVIGKIAARIVVEEAGETDLKSTATLRRERDEQMARAQRQIEGPGALGYYGSGADDFAVNRAIIAGGTLARNRNM